MELLDVIVVGGGPAGSTCAGILKKKGFSVTVVDKASFPRSKLCAGWITNSVFTLLNISPEEYSRDNTLQPISSFVVWDRKHKAHPVDFGETVSYGILRKEFDGFLLKKSGVEILENYRVKHIRKMPGYIELNNDLRAKVIIGAGGHFCPVSKFLGNGITDTYTLAAMESETLLDEQTIKKYIPYPGSPEIIYLEDLKGYAWFFSKGNYLTIGIGSLKKKELRRNLTGFLDTLKRAGRLPDELLKVIAPFQGHPYKIYPGGKRTLFGDRVLLTGDSAGLASSTSGEGILPAVRSAILAAETISEANGVYTRETLGEYQRKIVSVFGKPNAQPVIVQTHRFERVLFNTLLLGTAAGRRYIINNLFL